MNYTLLVYERTMKHLNRAPRGMAFYLSNIGKIDYKGQMIYPVSDIAGPEPPRTTGYRKTGLLIDDGKRMYIRLTPAGEQLFPPDQEITFTILQNQAYYSDIIYAYDTFDGMDELINRYRVLLNAIERKFNYLVEDIDFQEIRAARNSIFGSQERTKTADPSQGDHGTTW